MNDIAFLILAAGQGRRFGMPKQFYIWRGQELWIRSYNIAKNISNDVVSVGLDVDGGSTRQASVKSGLRLIDSERVVILETARPLINEQCIHTLLEVQHPSVTYGLNIETPIYSREKRKYIFSEEASLIENLQVFDTALLKEAHNKTKMKNAPDDTCLMQEVHGIEPYIVPGSLTYLYKLTTKEDLPVLSAMLEGN